MNDSVKIYSRRKTQAEREVTEKNDQIKDKWSDRET